MSELVITPNFTRKTARFHGTVAAGEHADVRIVDAASVASETLRLRVVFFKKTLAVFPIVSGESEAFVVDGDDLTCTINLNTVQAQKAFRRTPEMEVIVVLDDPVQHQLHFAATCLMRGWPQEVDDIPVDLDGYKDFVAETNSAIAALQTGVSENAAAIAAEQIALAQKANTSDLAGLATKEDLESEQTAREEADAQHSADISILESRADGHDEGIAHAEQHITNHALDDIRHVTDGRIKAVVAELFAEKNYDLSTADGFVEAFIDVVQTLGGEAHD